MDTKPILKAYFYAASTNIQSVVANLVNNPNIVSSMGGKYGVVPEKNDILQSEIIMVLLGMEPLSGLRANLVEELGITYDQALKISFESNTQIFNPVMDELKRLEEVIKNGGKLEIETPGSDDDEIPDVPDDEEVAQEEEPETTQVEQANPFIPNPSKTGVVRNTRSNGMETDPDHMLMDHEEMEKVDGVHLHSQNVMPSANTHSTPAVRQSFFSSKPQGESIVDQKLSRIFKPASTPTPPSNLPTGNQVKPQSKGYGEKDPYREPLQ